MQVQMRIPLAMRDVRVPFRPLKIESKAPVYWYKSGRVALYSALRCLALSRSGKNILLPAYHCRSMVEACEWAGLNPQFYEVNRDLSPSIRSVRQKLSSQTLAVVVVHYFGFPSELSAAVDICDKVQVPIIEDAAHIDVINNASPDRVGNAGDWIIGSPRKFYPIYDGGCLYSNKLTMESFPEGSKPTLGDEARSFLYSKDSLILRRNITRNISENLQSVQFEVPKIDDEPERGDVNSGNSYLDRRFTLTTPVGMTNVSKIILRALADKSMWQKRRENYRRISEIVSSLSRCSALYPVLPDDVVPYVFPLILKYALSDHRKLRSLALDIWRWEDLAPSNCGVSSPMELDLVQLPCHQALSDEQIDYMEDVLNRILK